MSPTRAIVCAACSLPLLAATLEADAAPPRIDLTWIDPTNALPDAVADVVEEVALIFEPLGLAVACRSVGPGELIPPSPLRVILLDDDRGRADGRVMGLTPRDPDGTHALWVLLPNIKRALGLDPERRRPLGRGDALRLARAIGRVVAHEVVHVLAPGLRHAGRGLMAESLGRTALVGARPLLDPESVRAVLAAYGVDERRASKPGRSGAPSS